MRKKGFTLVELLAVIVILAIILAIAIPSITNIISSASTNAFGADAKLVLKALNYKVIENSAFDVTTVNETNITSLLGVSSANYESVTVTLESGKPKVVIIGKNKWKDLAVHGTSTDLVIEQMPSGLVGYWKFDGNANDSSENNYNGTVYGATLTTDHFGKASRAYLFDGVDDYIDINTSAGLSSNYTLSWWMKNGALTGERHPIGLGLSSLQCYLADTSSQLNLYNGTFSLNVGSLGTNWSFITIVSQAGVGTKLYLNGVEKGTNASVQSLTTSNLDVGRRYGGAYSYPGSIDNVRLYNRALTPTEINILYNVD